MVFCFVQKFVFGQHESQNLILSRKARIFFPEFNIRLSDKISESDYFFFSTKIRIFFSATLGIRIFFQKKTITPLQVKWSFPYIQTCLQPYPPKQTYYMLWGRSYNPTVRQSDSPTVRQSDGPIVRQMLYFFES